MSPPPWSAVMSRPNTRSSAVLQRRARRLHAQLLANDASWVDGWLQVRPPAPLMAANSLFKRLLRPRPREDAARQMESKEDKCVSGISVAGAAAIHPPSRLHSLSVWPDSTRMTPDHSSSLHPSITRLSSASHFSGPRPELPPPVTGDAIGVDYLPHPGGRLIKHLLSKV